jgi:MFS family permease
MKSLKLPSQVLAVGRAIRVYDLVFITAFLWFMVQFLRYVFPPLFETIQGTYGVSNTQTGLLFTLLMLGYSAMQFPAGWLADRFDEVTVIAGAALFFTGAALFAAASPTFLILVVAAICIGLGTGAHKTVAIPLLSRAYPQQTGLTLGIMDTIGQFGGMVAPLVVVVVLGTVLPWSSVFVIGAVASGLLALLFYVRSTHHITVPEQPESQSESEVADGGDSYASIFLDNQFLAFVLVTVMFTFAWNGVSSFFPLFLSTEKGLTGGEAGVLYSVLFAVSVSQTVTGAISDRLGRLGISFALFLAMAGGTALLLVVDSFVLLAGVTVLMGLGFHGFRPVRDSYLMDVIPASIGGGTLGIVRTVMTIIGALAPATVGLISDVLGFGAAFGLIVLVLTLASVLVFLLK